MENGTFHNLSLANLDFESADVPSDKMEMGPTSFQTLMAQNEDLVARLRVTLKRLSLLEEENQNLTQNIESIRTQSAAVYDQLLIWKEKEKIWRDREQTLEKNFRDKTREMEIELSLLRQKNEKMTSLEEKLERHVRYHEKIKTSVRPYIHKLRGYTRSLFEQTKELNSSLLQSESQLNLTRNQLEQAREQNLRAQENFEIQKNQLISIFEAEREDLRAELKSVQSLNENLQERTRHLDRSLERQDELENLIVALRRSKEELLTSHHEEISSLKESQRANSQNLQTLTLKLDDVEAELKKTKETLQTTEDARTTTDEQLSSLRYMWMQKTQENEKLKMTAASLEKINSELSQKLTELRNSRSEGAL